MSVKLIYKDIAPGAKDNISQITPSEFNSYIADVNLLKVENNPRVNYASLEENQWRLDGSFKGIPADCEIAFWSTQISGDEASYGRYLFENPIKITREFANKHTSLGVSFIFAHDSFCNWLNVIWYNDTEIVANVDFYPDSNDYYCKQDIALFNKVEITFYSMNMPNRFLKAYAIDDGVNRTYDSDNLYKVSVLEDMSLISEELPKDTLTVSLCRTDDTELIFQKKQPVYVYLDEKLRGTYFIDGSERTSRDVYDVTAQDYIGVLDMATFYGGIYFDELAGNIIDSIFQGENIKYTVDEVTRNTKLSGFLPICTKREALAQVIFACCSVCETARSDKVNIFKLSNNTCEIGPERIYINGTLKTTNIVTAVKIQIHKYTRASSKTEVYNGDVFAGLNLVEFSNPIDTEGVTITGATLVECYNNYAIVQADSDATITVNAYEYVDNISTKTMINENVTMGTATNQVEISDATLISVSNADLVLQYVFEHKMKNQTFETDVVLLDEMCGDYVTMPTEWSGIKSGRIEQLEYDLRNKAIGKVVMRIDG